MKRMKQNRKWIVLAGIALFFLQSQAQEAPIAIGSKVDKSHITIGDVITYTVTITYDPNVQIFLPGQAANLGGFEIRDYEEHAPRKVNGQIELQLDYMISTFVTGEFDIPPLPVGYQLPGDSTQSVLSSEAIHIVVESVKPSEAGDIIDIKPPESIPLDWWYYGRWVALGLGVLVLAAAGIWVYKRKKAGEPILGSKTQPRPPHEIALEALNRLAGSDYLEKGEIKSFYIELSDIMRHYCEGRYYIQAMEMVTDDILRDLSAAGISEEDKAEFETLFVQGDLVKFAKAQPENAVSLALLSAGRQLVERTQVVLEPVDESSTPENPETDLREVQVQIQGTSSEEPSNELKEEKV